jgi:hypothetical protein
MKKRNFWSEPSTEKNERHVLSSRRSHGQSSAAR